MAAARCPGSTSSAHLLPGPILASMSSLANIIALVLLVVCAFLWLRAMYHQFEFAGKKPE